MMYARHPHVVERFMVQLEGSETPFLGGAAASARALRTMNPVCHVREGNTKPLPEWKDNSETESSLNGWFLAIGH